MEKRALLAIVLCICIAYFYPKWIGTPQVPTSTAPVESVASTTEQQKVEKASDKVEKAADQNVAQQEIAKKIEVTPDVPVRDIVVKNDIYQITFSNYGGCIKKVIFHEMKNDPKSRIVFNIDEYKYAPLNITRIGTYSGLENAVYDFERKENGIIFKYKLNEDITVVKDITVDAQSYLVSANVSFVNSSDKSIYLADGYDINAGLLFPEAAAKKIDYLGVDGLMRTDNIYRQKLKKVNGRETKNGDFKWVGSRNRTFASVLIAKDFQTSAMLVNSYTGEVAVSAKKHLCGSAMRTADIEVPASGQISHSLEYYAGPKYMGLLESFGYGVEQIMDLGFFSGISVFMIKILNFIYGIIPNYGIAIILLTILIKLILFPLTSKSFKSMNRMKALQPEINKLKDKYKDNPKKMQVETMGLYKKHKVNPLGGCLPILLQLPIFFALFAAIRDFVELQGASFLWAKDLSGPDTVMVIMGSIPVNPLPLLMGASMFFQQKMSTVDPAQQRMMMFMPIIFTVMLYNFSSGLVIYWLVNNVLSIAQQAMIQKNDA